MQHAVTAMLALSVFLMVGYAHARESGVDEHGGFFLRLAGGVGSSNTTENVGGTELSMGGFAFFTNIGIGFTVVPNLIISGTLFRNVVSGPTVELDGQDIGDYDAEIQDSAVGVGLTYYFMPYNAFVSASVAAAFMTVKIDGQEFETGTGWGVEALVGKEWWVSDNWGIGAAAHVFFSRVPDEGVDETLDLDTLSLGVLFTATYNEAKLLGLRKDKENQVQSHQPLEPIQAPQPWQPSPLCKDKRKCREWGECTWKNRKCIVGGDGDCLNAGDCTRSGNCSFDGKKCVPSSDQHCQESNRCKEFGNCSLAEGECVPGSQAHCDGAPNCKTGLGCLYERRRCWPNCAGSDECRREGKCIWGDCEGACVVSRSGEDCAKSTGCREEGRCTVVGSMYRADKSWDNNALDEEPSLCAAVTTADCANSEACIKSGRCKAVDGKCVKKQDCARSKWCKSVGLCANSSGECRASVRGCRKSVICALRSSCSVEGIGCSRTPDSCRFWQPCKEYGQCTWKNGGCVIGSNDDCQQSTKCKDEGCCDLVDGECQVASTGGCQRTEGCKTSGNCTWRDGQCLPGSNSDCGKTDGCNEEGRCTYRKGDGCVLARSADCKRTRFCLERGRCTFSPENGCIAASSGDCRRSSQCKSIGYCFAKDGSCVEEWDILSRRKRIQRSMKECRGHMAKLSKLKSQFVSAARSGDDETRWELDEQLEQLESRYQETADRLNDILEEMQDEGASESEIRKFVNETRRNCTN